MTFPNMKCFSFKRVFLVHHVKGNEWLRLNPNFPFIVTFFLLDRSCFLPKKIREYSTGNPFMKREVICTAGTLLPDIPTGIVIESRDHARN